MAGLMVFSYIGDNWIKEKVIITLIGTGSIQPMYHFPHKLIMKWVYKRADRLVAVSQNTKKKSLKLFPV